MSDSSLLGKAVKKVQKAGQQIYDNRHEILEAITIVAMAAAGGIISCSLGANYGYSAGCRDGWNLANEHTKEILEASSRSHETIIKQ